MNRTVHGLTPDGASIARYDSGAFYVEPKGGTPRAVSAAEAAELAAQGTHFPGRIGGHRLDAIVREVAR